MLGGNRKSHRECTDSELRAQAIALSIISLIIFGGTFITNSTPEWWLWCVRVLTIIGCVGNLFATRREFKRRRDGSK